MLCAALARGLRVAEVPIRFEERREGRSKLDAGTKAVALREILALALRERRRGRGGQGLGAARK